VKGWVLVTRGSEQTSGLASVLARHGLRVVPYPTLTEVPVEDPPGWSRVAERLHGIEWLVFTSPRAVAALSRQAEAHALAEKLVSLPVAAVGEGTAEAARREGYHVHLIGPAGAVRLARLLIDRHPGTATVLHACGKERRRELAEGLEAAGVEVLQLVVYGTVLTPPHELPLLPGESPVAVVLSSPRAARGYFQACGRRFVGVPHLAFGAASAEECLRHGVSAVALAHPTPAAIVEELCPTS
jgi:uroporphyrinogen-III synthase